MAQVLRHQAKAGIYTLLLEYKCLLWLDGAIPHKYLKTPFGEVLLYNYIKGQTWFHDVSIVSELLTRVHKHKYPKGLRILSALP